MDAAEGAGSARGASATELADAFCRQARLRVDALLNGLWHNTDALDTKLAKRILDSQFTWAEEGIVDPSIPGPWIAAADPGPSEHPNVHRTIG